MRGALAALTVLTGVVVGTMPAQAETWSFGGSGGILNAGAGLTFGGLEARAFIFDTNNGSANIPTTDVLNAVNGTAQSFATRLGQYAGGLGVTTVQGFGGDNGTDSPEHTMDNQLAYEFIVFKLPGSRTFSSLTLSSLSGGAGTGTGDADITAWIGGDSIVDFSFFGGKTLSNILGSPNTTSLSGTNFQQLNLTTASTCATGGEATNAAGNSAGCSDVVYTLDSPPVETPAPAGSDAEGPWLIIAAALTVNGSNLVDRDDDLLIASLSTESDVVAAPEPTALALFGVGAGFAFWHRRRRARG